jgi:hypothetical protein
MKDWNKKGILGFIILFVGIFYGYGQTGPGGVGNQATNVLWLRADDITGLSGGDTLSVAWPDTSGNDHDASQSAAGYRPLYITNAVNGKPVIRFDGNDDFLDNNHSYTAKTVFVIYRVSSSLQQNTELGQVWGNYGEGVHIAMDPRVGNLRGFSFDGTPLDVTRARYGLNSDSYGAFVSNDNNPPWTYDQWELITVEFENNESLTRQVLGSLYPSFAVGNHQFGGEIAEVIVFNTDLNSARRIIVENYLSSKYNVDISAAGNDYYSFESTNPYDLAGIGRQDASNTHTGAYSGKILGISNPSSLDADQEYLFYGHDGGDIASWTVDEVPAPGNNILRLAREWKIEETGDLGTFTFSIDTTLLPARSGGYTKFVLLIDADGDFSDGAMIYEMSSPGSNELYEVNSIDISSGYHIAIGTVVPTISFSTGLQDGFEFNNATLDILLNYTPLTDVSVDYYTTDVTAVAPGDYTAVASATATHPNLLS